MYFALMGKLDARRKGLLAEDEKGFTLIELLVVVIIIGILAAIAIPVYLNVQNNAKESAAKSDLANAKIAVIAYQTDKGSLPDGTTAGQQLTSDQANLGKYGFTKSDNTTSIGYKTGGAPAAGASTFCVQAQASTNTWYKITESTPVAAGQC